MVASRLGQILVSCGDETTQIEHNVTDLPICFLFAEGNNFISVCPMPSASLLCIDFRVFGCC